MEGIEECVERIEELNVLVLWNELRNVRNVLRNMLERIEDRH